MEVDPATAALFAKAVYQVRDGAEPEIAVARAGAGALTAEWSFDGLDPVSARTGAVLMKRSGFGMVGVGRPGARREGEVALALRGTFFKSPFDWATNANIAFQSGPGGLAVHAGFQRVAMQVIEQVGPPLVEHGRPVHLSGHSLGGALAQLVALWLRDAGLGEVHLYTFGAPRVLHEANAEQADRRLPNARRVFDNADPVPMIPIWPYAHGHGGRSGIRVGAAGGRIAIGAHDMSGYVTSVGQADWNALAVAGADIDVRRGVDHWIGEAKRATRIPGSTWGLNALGKALKALLRTAEIALGGFLLGAATTLDVLSSMLLRAAERLRRFDERLGDFVNIALRWLGRPPIEGGLTAALMRWTLDMVLRPILAMARSAISRPQR